MPHQSAMPPIDRALRVHFRKPLPMNDTSDVSASSSSFELSRFNRACDTRAVSVSFARHSTFEEICERHLSATSPAKRQRLVIPCEREEIILRARAPRSRFKRSAIALEAL